MHHTLAEEESKVHDPKHKSVLQLLNGSAPPPTHGGHNPFFAAMAMSAKPNSTWSTSLRKNEGK